MLECNYIDNNSKNMSLTIRNATPKDVRGIQTVFKEAWLMTYPNEQYGVTKEDIEEYFKDVYNKDKLDKFSDWIRNIPNNSKIFVAELENEIIGMCRIFITEDFNQLQAIYVLPPYQNQGIGKMLWDESLKYFDKNKKIIVQVATYNTNAIKFYEKLGFKDNQKRFTEERHRTLISKVLIPEMEMEMV